jgi:WS/DGAT/MGAT family acyltransferase
MLHSDAFAWYMEKDPVLRSTIVAVARLESSPDWDTLRQRIDRLTRLVPNLRMRVQAPPFRIGPPRWSVDESFDLDFHLRHLRLTEGAEWDDVLEFARTAAMDDFDRDRPLWEFTLLDGLSDGGGALVTKLHHSLSDGLGGVQLAAYVVDFEPDQDSPVDLPAAPEGQHLSTARLTALSVSDQLREAAASAAHVTKRLPRNSFAAVRHPVSALRDTANTTRSIVRFVAPINHQFSGVLGERHTGRHLTTIDLPLARLHHAAVAGGGHLNDAFMAGLVDGLHRYHERCGQPLDEVRVTVPISIRKPDDPVGGNRITLTRVRVPAALMSPAERVHAISAVMREWRKEPALDHTQGIAQSLNFLPRSYLGGIFKRVEMLASDVPGLPRPVWLAGARITGYYAFGPTIGSALNATLMSYADVCNIGLNIDTGAIDDPAGLIECMREAFDELLELAPLEGGVDDGRDRI